MHRLGLLGVLDTFVNHLEILLLEADDAITGRQPKDGKVRHEIAPDGRRLLDIRDVVVLKKSFLEIGHFQIFILESENVDLGQGAEGMHLGAKGMTDGIEGLLQRLPNRILAFRKVVAKDGRLRRCNAFIQRLERPVENGLDAHCDEGMPDRPSLDLLGFLLEILVRSVVNLLTDLANGF